MLLRSLHSKCILLLDKYDHYTTSLREQFQQQELPLIRVKREEDALLQLEQQAVQLLICIAEHEPNAIFELSKSIKSKMQHSLIPIVLVSQSLCESDIQNGRAPGGVY